MTTGAIVITWGAPVRGREAKALEVFGRALATMEGLAKEGRIHAHKEYFNITGNATTFAGCQIVEGQVEELLKLQVEEDFRRLILEASNIVENFTVTVAAGGTDQAIQTETTRYMETLQNLGYF